MTHKLAFLFVLLVSQAMAQTNVFPSSGNVGIGTISPGYKLTVEGEIHVNKAWPYVQLNAGYWGGAASFIQNGVTKNAEANGDFFVLYNPANKGFNFRQGGVDALTIAANGLVGIGNSNPTGKLDINHAGGQLRLSGGTVAGGVWTNSTDILYLADWNSGTKGLNINMSTGNIGIGTFTPASYKLAVEGKIGAREVNVTTNAWSDYVFNADYKLRPLTEVQQFIEENHHLPEVPSEKEVLANGQNLGEMNAILLKKIEELTLYQIEANKKIEALQEELKKLTKP